MTRQEFFDYVKEEYGTLPEYLWKKSPGSAVLRHQGNRKWYAILMQIPAEKLGLPGNGVVDVLDIKGDPAMIAVLLGQDGYYPAYHMNKTNWISILLEGTITAETVFHLLDHSYEMTKSRGGIA